MKLQNDKKIKGIKAAARETKCLSNKNYNSAHVDLTYNFDTNSVEATWLMNASDCLLINKSNVIHAGSFYKPASMQDIIDTVEYFIDDYKNIKQKNEEQFYVDKWGNVFDR